jgi:hypothetical protein
MLLLVSIQRMYPRRYITTREEIARSLLRIARSSTATCPADLLGDKAILDDLLDALLFTIAVEGGRV